jgi:membrane protein required for colicin V production
MVARASTSETIMNMQYYDLVMVAVLVGATVFGFWKGMAWQLASLASLVVSIFVAAKFRMQLAPMFGQQAPMNQFAAMLAIYAGSSFVIWMLFRFVSGAIDKVKLQAFDKQMGALFGFAKGVLLCVAITFFAVTLMPPAQGQAIVNSRSGHYIVAFLNKAESMVPPEYHQAVVPYLDKVEDRISNGNPNGGQGFQIPWPTGATQSNTNASSPAGGWPQIGWPASQPQTAAPQNAWPQQPSAPQQGFPAQSGWPTQTPQQLGWPAQTQSQPSQPVWPTDAQAQNGWPAQPTGQTQSPVSPASFAPNSAPREPNPFPDPGYSAERPTGATY